MDWIRLKIGLDFFLTKHKSKQILTTLTTKL